MQRNKEKYPLTPDHARVGYKHSPKTTKGMQKCIRDYIIYTGHKAKIIDTVGIYKEGAKWEDVLGHTRIVKGHWERGSGERGQADISAQKKKAVYLENYTLSVNVEIEVKNKDNRSNHQKNYQASTEAAGGIYMIARVGFFDEWVDEWEAI